MSAAMRRLGLALLVFAASCGGEDVADAPDAAPPPAVTWHQDIAPLVAEKCVTCHRDGGIAPFSMERFEDAQPAAALMIEAVEAGQMPPWDAVSTEDCAPRHPWREDPRLSETEVALLREWVELGAPEGDAATAAPLPAIEDLHITGVTHELEPATEFIASGTSDQMICNLMDPGITTAMWLEALEFTPGNLAVVHHAVLVAVPPEAVAAVQAEAGPDGQFDCFGGTNVEGAYTLGVWVPGSLPFEAGPDIGIPLAPGTQMLMQLHYHAAGTVADPDVTRVAMRLTDRAPGRNLIFTAVGNAPSAPILQPGPNDRGFPEFRIPANVKDHTETMVFPIEIEAQERFPILAVFPHMHYIGVDLETRITRATPLAGEPAEECLFKTPRWDFDWQRTYFYDAPVNQLPTVGDGDVITIECLYDNTLENPFVHRGLEEMGLEDPIDVFLGEETLDEMCLAGLAILF